MTLEGARRVFGAVKDDWDARMHAHDTRVSGYDDVRIDGERRIAAWMRVGMLVLEAPAELVGIFFPDLGLFRWWWSGKENSIALAPSRLDEAFSHAQKSDLRALLTRQHQLDGEEDAAMLCKLAAYFAHATALVREKHGDRVSYYAIFAAASRPPIVPDREIVRTLPPPAVAPSSLRPSELPAQSEAAIREPARNLVAPLANVANTLLQKSLHDEAERALCIVNVDTSRDKIRFFVTVVALGSDSDMHVLDTTRELMDAAGAMLVDDARAGNGRWRKLVIRFDCAPAEAMITRCEVS
jgi:hypothetical protein